MQQPPGPHSSPGSNPFPFGPFYVLGAGPLFSARSPPCCPAQSVVSCRVVLCVPLSCASFCLRAARQQIIIYKGALRSTECWTYCTE